MPRTIPLLALALAMPAAAQDFPWHDNLEVARAQATREGKPLLLLFRCEP